MKDSKKWVTVLGSTLVLMGCGYSPLFNHADAASSSELAVYSQRCQFSFPVQKLCASITWVKQPTDTETGELTLKFWNSLQGTESGPYVTPAFSPSLKLWMPSMGHGSSPVKLTAVLDAGGQTIPGLYNASNVFFVMGGKWEIWVQLKQDSQIVEQSKIDVEI